MSKKDKLIYLAGFFDGEGCITFGSNSKRDRIFTLRIVVTQCNPIPIKMLKQLFGVGYIYRGGVYNSRSQFVWEVKGRNAVKVLEKMLPYLQVKRDEAELAVGYYKLPWRVWGNHRNEEQKVQDFDIVNKVKNLKKRNYMLN